MTTWPSSSATPASTVYPADQHKWQARTDIPQPAAIQTDASGRPVTIIELRGWLDEVNVACNVETDWHWGLILDPLWLQHLGIPPEDLIRPGDLTRLADGRPDWERRRSGPVSIHIELDAWPRTDARAAEKPAKPGDWRLQLPTDVCPPAVFWPWDPRYNNGDQNSGKFAKGDYVSVWGSLVTDEPHDWRAVTWTVAVWSLGLDAARATPGIGSQLDGAAAAAAKWLWFPPSPDPAIPGAAHDGDYDPANPNRWNEIHSPDQISKVADPNDPGATLATRWYQQVVVVAQPWLTHGDTEHYVQNLAGPPIRPPGAQLAWKRHETQWTRMDTVASGPTITASEDHITVDVTVQAGRGPTGAVGKYAEIFELWWEMPPPPPPLNVSGLKYGRGTETLHVEATDNNGNHIDGAVIFNGTEVARTFQDFTYTWTGNLEDEDWEDAKGHVHHRLIWVPDDVSALVRASGYPDTPVPLQR